MKQSPKYLNNKKRKSALVPILITFCILLIAGIAVMLFLFRQPSSPDQPGSDPTTVPRQTESTATEPQLNQETEPSTPSETESVLGYATLETAYGPLMYSEQHAAYLKHVESIDGEMAVEVFYMIYNDSERELFRIYFGNMEMGDPVGILETNSGEISVSAAACVYEADEFADEDSLLLYYELMEELNIVLDSIRNDSRFKEIDTVDVPVSDKTNSELSYWTFSLPQNVDWEESTAGNVYQADFYGTVAGDRIKLYTIYLGEAEADSLLGYYQVNGETKPVYVKSYDLAPDNSWTDEDLMTAYSMMESINDVIQTIMSHENFSTVIEQ